MESCPDGAQMNTPWRCSDTVMRTRPRRCSGIGLMIPYTIGLICYNFYDV